MNRSSAGLCLLNEHAIEDGIVVSAASASRASSSVRQRGLEGGQYSPGAQSCHGTAPRGNDEATLPAEWVGRLLRQSVGVALGKLLPHWHRLYQGSTGWRGVNPSGREVTSHCVRRLSGTSIIQSGIMSWPFQSSSAGSMLLRPRRLRPVSSAGDLF